MHLPCCRGLCDYLVMADIINRDCAGQDCFFAELTVYITSSEKAWQGEKEKGRWVFDALVR